VAAASTPPRGVLEQNSGWILGAIVIAGVLAFGLAAWLIYHP
jgi:hypothetical protein